MYLIKKLLNGPACDSHAAKLYNLEKKGDWHIKLEIDRNHQEILQGRGGQQIGFMNCFQSTLFDLTKTAENTFGVELLPSYDYSMKCKKGAFQWPRVYEEDTEYTIEVFLRREPYVEHYTWPIIQHISKGDQLSDGNIAKKNAKIEYLLTEGDALCYKGMEHPRSRPELKLEKVYIAMFHYVAKYGKYGNRVHPNYEDYLQWKSVQTQSMS